MLVVDGQPQSAVHHQIDNTVEKIGQLFAELGKQKGFALDECLVCVEATGVYAHPLLTFTAQHGAHLWLESAVRIKKSIGLQRGKNDKAGALRLTQSKTRKMPACGNLLMPHSQRSKT